jgi:hypothetical protein
MKTFLYITSIALSVFLTGCASPNKRIDQNKALFNTYTTAEKKIIRTGQIAVGFDPDQVRMALGEPSRETMVDTPAGKQPAWEYRELKPSLGLSIGGGSGTRGSGVGIGTGLGGSPDRSKLLKRIVFDRESGTVGKIESHD